MATRSKGWEDPEGNRKRRLAQSVRRSVRATGSLVALCLAISVSESPAWSFPSPFPDGTHSVSQSPQRSNQTVFEFRYVRDPVVKGLLEKATASRHIGNLKQALALAEEALETSKRQRDALQTAEIAAAVGRVYLLLGDFEKAKDVLSKALELAIDAQNEEIQADALTSLAMPLSVGGQHQQAKELEQRAVTLARKNGSLKVLSRALSSLGNTQVNLGELDVAAQNLDEALRIAETNSYKDQMPSIRMNVAILHWARKNFDSAERELVKAGQAAEGAEDHLSHLAAQTMLARVYAEKKSWPQAISLFESVLRQARESELVLIEAAVLETLALAYEANGERDKAAENWTNLLQLVEQIGNRTLAAESHFKLGLLGVQQNQIDLAISHLESARSAYQSLGNTAFQKESLIALAGLYEKKNNYEKVFDLSEEALTIAHQLRDHSLTIAAYASKGYALTKLGKLQDALKAFEEAVNTFESVETPSDADTRAYASICVSAASTYAQAGNTVAGVEILLKGLTHLRKLSDQQPFQEHLKLLSEFFDATKLSQAASKFYADGKLYDASLTYAFLAMYFELRGETRSLAEALQRFDEILTKEQPSADLLGKLQKILPAVWRTNTLAEATLLYHLQFAYSAAGKTSLASQANLELSRILQAKKDSVGVEIVLADLCAGLYTTASLMNTAQLVEVAKSCKAVRAATNDPKQLLAANLTLFDALLRDKQFEAAEKVLNEIVESGVDPKQQVRLRLHLAASAALSAQSRKAEEQSRKALSLAEKLGDQQFLAEVRASCGYNYVFSPDALTEGVSLLNKAEAFYAEARDADQQVQVLLMMVRSYLWRVGDAKKALQVAEKAVTISREHKEKLEPYGDSLSILGDVYSNLEKRQEAIRAYQSALTIYRQVRSPGKELTVLTNLATEYSASEKRTESIKCASEALALAEKSGDPLELQSALSTLGGLHEDAGEYELARGYFERALEEITGRNRALEALTLSRLVNLLVTIGDFEAALSYAERNQKIQANSSDRDSRLRHTVLLADIYADRRSPLRDPTAAERLYLQALSEIETLRADDEALSVRHSLGELYVVEGRYKDATPLLESAVSNYEKKKQDYSLAHGLLTLSEAYTKAGRLRDAKSAIEHARSLASRQKDFYLNGRLQYNTAVLLRAEGKFGDAIPQYEKVIELLEKLRSDLTGQEKVGITGAYKFIYEEVVSSYYGLYQQAMGPNKTNLAQRALEISESNRARQFRELLGTTFLREGAGSVPADMLQRERSLTTRKQALLNRLMKAQSDGEKKADILAELESVNKEMDDLIGTLRRASPEYASLKYPTPLKLSDVPVSREELLIVYEVGAEGTYLWALAGGADGRPSIVAFLSLPVSPTELSKLVDDFRRPFAEVAPLRFHAESSERLFNALLAPLGNEILARYKRVVFVPDGDLYLIPFEALSPKASLGEYVLGSKQVAYFPSLSAMALLRKRGSRSPAPATLFAMGDPVSDPNDERILFAQASGSKPQLISDEKKDKKSEQARGTLAKLRSSGFSFYRLPATGQEVSAVAEALHTFGSEVELKVGFEASKRTVFATDLSRFRFIHFATHGVLPGEAPGIGEPAIVLSLAEDEPLNMFLRMSDVLNLKLNAELVTLSACETGLGKNLRAEGVIGLPRAFMFAGASAVVVSLWKVADDSTAELMKEFYTQIANGHDKVAALAIAKSKLRDAGRNSPFFWAPFIIWGE